MANRELENTPPAATLTVRECATGVTGARMPSEKINLVTGATGQLGSHVAEQLRTAGENVRVLVRPGRDLGLLRQLGVEIVEGDLRDAESVKRAADGAAIV